MSNAFIAQEAKKLKGDLETLNLLFQSLKYEGTPKDSVVFKYGDSGSTFYILLAGEVEIRVPTTVELQGNSATPEGLLVFLITYHDIIYWDKIQDGYRIRRELYD